MGQYPQYIEELDFNQKKKINLVEKKDKDTNIIHRGGDTNI